MKESLSWTQNVTEKGVHVCREVHISFHEDFHQLSFQIKDCLGKELKKNIYERVKPWSEVEYCDASTIFQGVWHTGAIHYQSYEAYCPQLYNSIPENKRPWYFYTSPDPFKLSYFYPNDGCYTLPLNKSLEVYKSLTGKDYPNWRFIGDSLGRQIDITARCEFESIFSHSFLDNSIFNSPTFLRSDNSYNQTSHKYTFTTPYHSYSHDKMKKEVFSWMYHLPHDLDFVVLNTGAWYSIFHLNTPQATLNFTETIFRLLPHLEHFMEKNPSTTVFWLGLPSTRESNAQYGWDEFETRNQIIKHFLEPLGVIYFDMEAFGGGRKSIGDKILRDEIHWVCPGTFSIPSFAFERILHLHVMRMLQRANMTI
eukprot:gene9665-10492_t